MHGSSPGPGRLSRALFLALLVVSAAAPTGAVAALLPLDLLIQDGLVLTSYARPDGLGVIVSANRPVFTVANGQKSASSIGRAVIYVWKKPVPAPIAASFGASTGLVVVHLDPPFDITYHLGLIQAPSGALYTTIGVSRNAEVLGGVDLTIRGSWSFVDGSQVVGGDANDLVIRGTRVSNTPLSLGPPLLFSMEPLFATDSDISPMFRQVVGPTCTLGFCLALGVFNGFVGADLVNLPVRSFAISTTVGDPAGNAHILVTHVGGIDYVVVACSSAADSFTVASLPLAGPYTRCTLSGVGSAADVSGTVDYCCVETINPLMTIEAFSVP